MLSVTSAATPREKQAALAALVATKESQAAREDIFYREQMRSLHILLRQQSLTATKPLLELKVTHLTEADLDIFLKPLGSPMFDYQ